MVVPIDLSGWSLAGNSMATMKRRSRNYNWNIRQVDHEHNLKRSDRSIAHLLEFETSTRQVQA